MVALTIAPTFLVLSLHRCIEQVMTIMSSGRSELLSFLPRTYLRSVVGLDSFGLLFQIIGTAVLAANSTLSTSQVGAGLAVTGLAIQSLTLVLALSLCTICGFWACGYARDLNLSSFWKATEECNTEAAQISPSSLSKRFRSFVAGMLLP